MKGKQSKGILLEFSVNCFYLVFVFICVDLNLISLGFFCSVDWDLI